MNSFTDYTKTKSASNRTMAYWLLYIKMVQILLIFIRATRQNNWKLHLSAVRSMLPWFFSTDQVNYARFGTMYWLEMISLDKTHPGKKVYDNVVIIAFPAKKHSFYFLNIQQELCCTEFHLNSTFKMY